MTDFHIAHVIISTLALSLLVLAGFQALLMGGQHLLLKHHCACALLRFLPCLQAMETLLFSIVGASVIFLFASLASGFFFHPHLFTASLLPKTVLSLSAWVLLTTLLLGRFFFGWRGATAVRWTLCSVMLVFLSYFGTKWIAHHQIAPPMQEKTPCPLSPF